MNAPVLKVSKVEAGYGAATVLRGLSLFLNKGEAISILGRNGMGKTTTIKAIMGIVPASSGCIEFNSRVLNGLPEYKVARCGIGLVPEGRQIFPNLTVEENLTTTAANRHALHPPWKLIDVYDMFPRLRERRNNLGMQLSGGEQQMLAIGRALMLNPFLLILDEATEGLAPFVTRELWQCLDILKQRGMSLIVVDKNIDPLLNLCDRHYVVEKGEVVWSGSSSELREGKLGLSHQLGV